MIFHIALTIEQTRPSFARTDPTTHTLQQKVVNGKLWALVAAAHEKLATIKKLEEGQQFLMTRDQTDDASITETRDAIAGLTAEASLREKEREQIERAWNNALESALSCHFSDGGARNFDEALSKYDRWLSRQSRQPPQP